jgi:hypothetical protein
VLLLGVPQVILPRLAVQRIRDQIKPYGSLQSASVSAFPALELLWGKAEAVHASARTLTLSAPQAMKLVWEGRGVRDVNLAVGTMRLQMAGLPEALAIHDVSAIKRSNRLQLRATLTQRELSDAAPGGVQVRLLGSEAGGLNVRASGALFGVQASVDALVQPREGKLVAQPVSIPFGTFVTLVLFSDPHIYLDSVSADPIPGAGEASWRLGLSAHLR